MKRSRLFVLVVAAFGCATSRAPTPAARSGQPSQDGGASAPHECPCKHKAGARAGAEAQAAPTPVSPDLDHALAAVPVTREDPTWGSREAPVTIVVWSDFQCPFCARAGEILDELKQDYGPAQLRIVWKNYPLPFHPEARPAAEAAMTVFALGGSDAFWLFHDRAFANQGQLTAGSFAAWAAAAGVDRARFEAAMAAHQQQARIDGDLAQARKLQIRGTPMFRINGLSLVGAQPIESFRAIIDSQKEAAKALLESGMPALGVYPALCARNFAPPAPHEDISAPVVPSEVPSEDEKVWQVPVGKDDPSRGPEDALVTLVVFGDFECAYCKRLEATLANLRRKYTSDLRIVWKDLPLPFHSMAIPAAVLARLAAAKKGADGFWTAHDALMGIGAQLDTKALEGVARRLGVGWTEVQEASADHRFHSLIQRGVDLAKELGVRGTPCSFVNGQRIEGALPEAAFVEVIDAQLNKARTLLESGGERAGLYGALTGTSEEPKPLERATVEGPTRKNPTKGSARAEVTVQVFGDFQCPHSLRIMPALLALQGASEGKVRLVWRNYPMAFHADAALAAEAAQEVFAQKGARGFWRYAEMLFEAQQKEGIGRDQLEKLAHKVGVDRKRFRAALDAHRHRATIERDIAVAKAAELSEMPSVLVNDYVLSGVVPLPDFERAVSLALEDVRMARVPRGGGGLAKKPALPKRGRMTE